MFAVVYFNNDDKYRMCDVSYMITMGTEVEFDFEKWEKNVAKHKYGLDCIADILEGMLIGRIFTVVSDEYEEQGEARFMLLAQYQGDIILAVCTWRDGGKTIRVISFRPANSEEEKIYYRGAVDFLATLSD